MANWSDTYIKIQSDTKTLHTILNDIYAHTNGTTLLDLSKYDEDYNNMEIDMANIIEKNGELVIQGQGQWAAPTDWFEEYIFKKYNVSGEVIDSDAASDFFIKITYDRGEAVEEIDTPYFSPESIKEYGAGHWFSIFWNDFLEAGREWGTKCAGIVETFKSAGISEEQLIENFDLQEKNILFIMGNSCTGKTTLADALTTKQEDPHLLDRKHKVESFISLVADVAKAEDLVNNYVFWDNYYDEAKEAYMPIEKVLSLQAGFVYEDTFQDMEIFNNDKQYYTDNIVRYANAVKDPSLSEYAQSSKADFLSVFKYFTDIVESGEYKTFVQWKNTPLFTPLKSTTTRPRRDKSEEKWYNFMFKEEFDELEIYDVLEQVQYGGHYYATLKKDLVNAEGEYLVKVVEPVGGKTIIETLKREYPCINTGIVLMDIDQKEVIAKMKENGMDAEEILDRITRGNEKADFYGLGLKADYVVKSFSDDTADKVRAFAKHHFMPAVILGHKNEYSNALENDQEMQEKPTSPSITLSPSI